LPPLCLPCAANAQATPTTLEQVLQAQDHDSHGDLRAVVVLREGAIVAERYYNGETADTLHDIRSAGKSITALLLGAAVARGQLATTKTVGEYWPEVAGSPAGKVALDDLLTMRSGLAAFDEDEQSPGNEDKLDAAPDPAAFVRGVPAATKPGSTYRYNSLGSYIAGRVVENASGADLEDYAAKALFAPLGIMRWNWGRDVAKHPKGQGNLSLRAREHGENWPDGARRRHARWPARDRRGMDQGHAGAARGHRCRGPLRRQLWLFLVREDAGHRTEGRIAVPFSLWQWWQQDLM